MCMRRRYAYRYTYPDLPQINTLHQSQQDFLGEQLHEDGGEWAGAGSPSPECVLEPGCFGLGRAAVAGG